MKKNTEKTLFIIHLFFISRVWLELYNWKEFNYLTLATIIDYLLIYILVVPIVNKLEKISK